MTPKSLLWSGIVNITIAGSAFAETYSFTCIPPPLLQQNCSDGSAQTSVVVTQPSPGQVLFTFFNVGSIPMRIANVYLDDGNASLQGPMTIIEAGSGAVDFSQDTPANNPPRGANLTPPFGSEFSASRVGGGVNAVDPGESVGIQLAIAGGKTFSHVLSDLASGALRVAEHVTSFTSTNGSSEAFVNTVGPSVQTADLMVTKFGPGTLESGQTTMYMVIVQNNGPNSANNVTMTDDVPAGMTIVWVDQSQGACSHTSAQVTCNLGTVVNGGFEYVIIQVTAPPTAGTITNSASVTSTTTDPTPSNNTGTVQSTVTSTAGPVADLSVTKTALPSPVAEVGENVTYTVTVTNNGPDAATGVVMLDLLPQAVTFLSATPSQGSCQPPLVNGTLECTVGSLANGASMTVTVVVQTILAGLIGNSASVFADQEDPNVSNNVTGMVVTNVGDVSRLVNISTRGHVGTAVDVMVGGFILGGNTPKQLLVRGFGPTLSSYGVSGAMANPTIELYWDSDGNPSTAQVLIATNDNWQSQTGLCDAPANCGSAQDIVDTGLSADSYAPTNPNRAFDSALLVTLPQGAYTVRMLGVNSGTGVGLFGVDDLDTATLPKLVNVSTRGRVLAGTPLVGGFIIGAGTGAKSVLLRGFGPTLTSFGLTGVLANPTLELYADTDANPNTPSVLVATNNDWQSQTGTCNAPAVCGTVQDITNTGMSPDSYAPTNANRALDSALLVTLPPGLYTVRITDIGATSGVALVGVDELGP